MSHNPSTRPNVTVATASDIGGRSHQCDATATHTAGDGTTAVALIDGIGSDTDTAHTAGLLAEVAARVGARRGALPGLLAAAELVSSGTADQSRPNAVGALAVTYPDGNTVVAHCGDVRAHSWNGHTIGLHTTDHTLFELLASHTHDRRLFELLVNLDTAGTVRELDDAVRTTLARATVASITTSTTHDPLVVLTSDGIHKRLSTDDIALFIDQNPDPDTLARLLVSAALQGPEPAHEFDNATAAVIHIG
ncbi:PP2C family serine/threonine-protein phosphatase [Saccharothrix xinjiangensis]|uniref:PPM-type phosphatase domain-containing protein n=1 Tax=Saccharothrix xinjiangensis TaxID=204798 RepID=A0ABV9XXR1_9PSEU